MDFKIVLLLSAVWGTAVVGRRKYYFFKKCTVVLSMNHEPGLEKLCGWCGSHTCTCKRTLNNMIW